MAKQMLLAGALVVFGAFLLFSVGLPTAGAVADPRVCLDPGHGGSAPGAVNGLLEEADINLDVAQALEFRLVHDAGLAVVMTRTDDFTKSTRDRYEFCNSQNATLMVSIHTNSVADDSIDGTLAIYFHKDDRILAQELYDAMWAKLKPTAPDPLNFVPFGLKKDALGVVLKSEMPAAVAEPVFMSHPIEAERLGQTVSECSDNSNNVCRRAQIVEALYEGIINYLALPPGDEGGNGRGGGPPPGRGR